jgi:ChrR Cupin-like domain
MNDTFSGNPFYLSPDMINSPDSDWQQLRAGVALRMLFQAKDIDYSVGLIRYEPGASVPLHLHTGDEHIYVLTDSQMDKKVSTLREVISITPKVRSIASVANMAA